MKNIRTILLLSATCLTIIGAETSFASLNGASLLGYKGALATSTSICNNIIPSPKGNVKSHTHLVAASPSPHLSSYNLPQTQSEHRASFAPTSLALTDGVKLPQLASVCFITDAGNCSGIGGAGSEDMPTSSGGPEDWELDSAQRCREEGYVNTICPEGASSGTPCPYDSNWHSGCICADTYNKSCTGSDQQGKGESCNGLYQECCNLCSDYPYTASNLPTGYVKGASCNSCSGTKYKAQCDSAYKYACTYNYTGHISGGSGTACDGKYKSCKCMSGYTWNASTGTCDISCDPAFDLTCTRSSYTHITGGDGSACDGKYQRCKCESGYTWNPINNQCEAECDLSYNLDCLPNSYTHILGSEGSACGGKYQRCKCESGYTWVSSGNYCEQECNSSYKYECTPSYSTGISGGSGSDCNGKYTACRCISGYTWNAAYGICEEDEPECDSSYKYTCTGSYQMTGTSSCDGKYQSCRCISGYTWNTAFGICEKDKPECGNEYKYSCMYSSTNHIIGGVGSACNGKYTACRCETGYTWNSSTETCGGSSSGCGSDYKYTCTYSTITHILSGSGISCGGKYKACSCMTGYEWNASTGTCTTNSGGNTSSSSSSGGDESTYPCTNKADGPSGSYYCCSEKIVGIKISSIFVSLKNIGPLNNNDNWNTAQKQCLAYQFCQNIKGTMPSLEQLRSIYNKKSYLNNQFSSFQGDLLQDSWYWSSTPYSDSYGYSGHMTLNMSDGLTNGWNGDRVAMQTYLRPILTSY